VTFARDTSRAEREVLPRISSLVHGARGDRGRRIAACYSRC